MAEQPESERRFETSLEIAAERSLVWKAIAEAGHVGRWFAPEVTMETRPGGAVRWSWRGLFDWPLTVEQVREGEFLRLRYDSSVQTDDGPAPLFVDWELEGIGGKTTLRLVHHGFGPGAEFDQEFDGISQGWPVELRSLRHYAEKHLGQPRQLAWSLLGIDLDLEEAWKRLSGQDALGCGSGPWKEGDAFEFTTVDGERFAGAVSCAFPRELSGRLDSHGEGFLRVGIEVCGGHPQAWLWLATYGSDTSATERVQKQWDAMLARVFADCRAAVEVPR